jgi:hypothetical protein
MSPTRSDADHDAGERILLVALPGAFMAPQEFASAGFGRMLRDHRLPVDLVAAGIDSGLYLDDAVPERIDAEFVIPARERGYRRIWLLGISLGGMGALQYLRRCPGRVEGAILLAPFLATRGLVVEVGEAGGLSSWRPGQLAPGDIERPLLAWLGEQNFMAAKTPVLYLGCGRDDRFAAASTLLSACLPPERVVAADGGHDWETWARLWQAILARRPFELPPRGA